MRRLRVGGGLVAAALAVRAVAACVGDDPAALSAIDAGVDAPATTTPPLDPPDVATVSYRDLILQEQPVAYWRLDGIADGGLLLDERDATVLRVSPKGVSVANDDHFGPSVHFDDGGYASAGDASVLQFSSFKPFTLELWGRLDRPDAGSFRVAAGGTINRPSNDPDGYLIFWSVGAVHTDGSLVFADASNATAFGDRQATPDLWTHYAFTYDGRTLLIYVNGVPSVSSATTFDALTRGPSLFTVGRDPRPPPDAPNYWIGNIAEVAVYSHALTTATLLAHVHAHPN